MTVSNLRETRSQDVNLNALIDGISTGQVVLPNFQRDFDWSDADIRSLLGTVLNGWPMGSLLLIEGNEHKEFYSPRPIENAPKVADSVIYIILDGQQRLTSLYQALTDKSDEIYAIKLASSIDYSDVDALDEAIVTVPREVWDKVSKNLDQLEDKLLPFSALRDAPSFYEWRDAQDFDNDFDKWLTRVYREHLSGIHSYRVPAVIVDSAIEPNAVARVFERVNRTGVKLGTFDLMVAKTYSTNFNLRTAWEQAQANHPVLIKLLRDDGLPILSTLALRESNDVRQSAVMNLGKDDVERLWGDAVKHYAHAASYAQDSLGVLDSDWLPYRQMLTILAAFDYAHPLEEHEALIKEWFWSTGFGRRYDAASNTRAVADYRELLALRSPVKSPLALIREQALEATRGQQGAWHRAYLCALATAASPGSFDTSDTLQARSLYPRGSGNFTPALHLRTLGFALWKSGVNEPIRGLVSERELPDNLTGLDARLNALKAFLSGELRESVKILSSDDDDVKNSLFRDIVSDM